MNRFNLTFSGEILAGEDPEQVRLRFADMFGIGDRARLERFFSGETVILRRNLERKDAAELYHQLQLLGAVGALVKVTTSELADEIVSATAPNSPAEARTGNRTLDTSSSAKAAAAPSTDTVASASDSRWTSNSSDAAAEIKARKLAAQRLAADNGAREKAKEEARQRLAAEEALQLAAEKAELKRLKEEEAAQKKALKAEARRKAAEKAAQRKAERAREKSEKAQRKAEAAERRKDEAREKKRLAAEEEARRKAKLAEQKRLAEEAEAQHKAELAEQKRLAEEAEARRKAELEANKRREVEKEARRQAALKKKKQLAAGKEARRLAELEQAKGLAAEEEARNIAEEAKKAADERAKREVKARHLDAKAATDGSAAIDLRDSVRAEHDWTNSVKPGGIQRAKSAGKSRVKTNIDVPLRQTGQTPEIGKPGQRRRPSAAPNLYKIRPFRNTRAVQARSARARQLMRKACAAGGIALTVLLIVAGSFVYSSGGAIITGASAVAVNTHAEPVLLAGDALLFHDRAGVSSTSVTLSALGVDALQPPLVFADEVTLLALGRLSGEQIYPELLRCDIALPGCEQFTAQLTENTVATFALNTLDNSVLLADATHNQLLKIDRAGALVASTDITFARDPVLRLHGGLLLMNSASGPAISVYRYEDSAFGQQLDEILLLVPSALPLESSRVSDFIWSGNAWWVVLRDSLSGSAALHRFDRDWSYLDTVPLEPDSDPVQLIRWREKILVNDPHNPAMQRFNAQGAVEAPFASTQLQSLIDTQRQRARLADLAWDGGLLLCALATLLCFALGHLHWMRTLVYRTQREQGAEPLDDHASALCWIEPVQDRPSQLRHTGRRYGAGALCAVLLAIALGVGVWQLAALLLVLCGPAIALLLLSRQPVGHIGILGERLLLVDHRGDYHLGGGPRLTYRGPFLSIDDIVVFTGSRLLPAFSAVPLQQHINPAAMGGIKVDTITIAVKLLESRHPLALGGAAIAASLAAGALLLVAQGLF